MPADYSRIHRLLRIITLIQSEKSWTAARLAEECGVTTRTIYRDLNMLEGAGIPYFFDEESKCYQIRRDFFMPPVSLTLDESLALIALGEHVGGGEQIPLMKPASKAIAKIRSQLPGKIRDDVEELDQHITIDLAKAGPHEGFEDVYDQVREAITRKKVLRCKYESVGRSLQNAVDGEPFDLHPYTLFFSQRAWYVLGHHDKRGEIRCLKLNRFSSIELTDEMYTIPESFSPKDHLGNAWRMIRGDQSYDVELEFDAEFAETISDTHWHSTQNVQWHEGGSITFTCTVDGLDEIVWWILSMGPHCVVKQPGELADRVQQLAQGMLDAYQTGREKKVSGG